jgi:hypothetical protein
MSHTIIVESPLDSQAISPAVLDETVWRRWLNKNRLEERQSTARRIKDVKWACICMLIVTAVVSPYVFAPYASTFQAAVGIAVGLGAIVLILESFRGRRYVFTGLFAGIVLLFNPVLPTVDFSENRLIVLVSVLPFLASLVWMKEKVRLIPALI